MLERGKRCLRARPVSRASTALLSFSSAPAWVQRPATGPDTGGVCASLRCLLRACRTRYSCVPESAFFVAGEQEAKRVHPVRKKAFSPECGFPVPESNFGKNLGQAKRVRAKPPAGELWVTRAPRRGCPHPCGVVRRVIHSGRVCPGGSCEGSPFPPGGREARRAEQARLDLSIGHIW